AGVNRLATDPSPNRGAAARRPRQRQGHQDEWLRRQHTAKARQGVTRCDRRLEEAPGDWGCIGRSWYRKADDPYGQPNEVFHASLPGLACAIFVPGRAGIVNTVR